MISFQQLIGTTPGTFQSTMLERVSSHGYAVVAPWTMASEAEVEYTGVGVAEVLQWANENLVQKLTQEEGERGDKTF